MFSQAIGQPRHIIVADAFGRRHQQQILEILPSWIKAG
jgi:hypothetical protein